MLRITRKSKIYIVTPANTASGGAELLHQLGEALNKLGLTAFMYYDNYDSAKYPSPIHARYEHYKAPFSGSIDDDSSNILIIPEVFDYFAFLDNFKNIQKVIWWLSVDYFYEFYHFKNNKIKKFFLRAINKLSKFITGGPVIDLPETALRACRNLDLLKNPTISKASLHLVQSEYAKQYLAERGVADIEYLSDYLIDEFLSYDYTVDNREDLVLFNPNKGFKFAKKIISYASDIRFLPIQNMSKQEVVDVMKRAKVYIDFGNHPGKDRMPRESAICGCCVITGKRGAAAFYKDVPIPDKYKFEDKKDSVPKIVGAIKYCMDNYKESIKDFDGYREVIKKEKNEFIRDVQRIFCPFGS